MQIPDVRQKWPNPINTVTIGATKEEGGTRSHTVTVGGATTLPYLRFEGEIPHSPVVAMEVWDIQPSDWPEELAKHFSDVWDDPGKWAKKCVDEFGADLICLRLQGCDPEGENRGADDAASAVRKVLESVGVPLIIWGCGNKEKDNEIFPACSQAASGERCLLGTITEDNYKTLVALCQADKHKVIAESPVDINIAKQVNILAIDAGLSDKDIVIYPTTGALGYGIEYVYSIMERGRIAGLSGDKMWAMPLLGDIGKEVWKIKEALVPEKDVPEWGDETKRGPMWEFITAVVYLQAGADILIMRHPVAVRNTRKYISRLLS
ncbi:acetyl-CoA decarbonylase/synthase complex subunit delta [Candidatus Aerophobetes bacterium]|nr:acetyl-CoA decarbonylase/synthase complex subunit delta [Candidatus Aerophobetes bacterium]